MCKLLCDNSAHHNDLLLYFYCTRFLERHQIFHIAVHLPIYLAEIPGRVSDFVYLLELCKLTDKMHAYLTIVIAGNTEGENRLLHALAIYAYTIIKKHREEVQKSNGQVSDKDIDDPIARSYLDALNPGIMKLLMERKFVEASEALKLEGPYSGICESWWRARLAAYEVRCLLTSRLVREIRTDTELLSIFAERGEA